MVCHRDREADQLCYRLVVLKISINNRKFFIGIKAITNNIYDSQCAHIVGNAETKASNYSNNTQISRYSSVVFESALHQEINL